MNMNREILRIALPNIVSNITVPLMGIVSTAIAGHWGADSAATIGALAIGIAFVMPNFQMPAFTDFIHGGGPIVGGPVIPFIFITLACGALSGFPATIGTGTPPKMVGNERAVLFVG